MSNTPINQHALLSDCGAAALVTSEGSVDWRCLPRFDSAPVLGEAARRRSRAFQHRPCRRTGAGGARADGGTDRGDRRRVGARVNVDISTDAVIRRPIAVVAAYASDPNNAPAWYVNISAVKWQTEPMLGLGSRVA